MYSDWSVFAGLSVLAAFIWLGILSYFIWQQNNFLRSLFPRTGERDIRKKFEDILKEVSSFREDLDKLDGKIVDLERLGLKHIQRVELVRYNPYGDTGGNISFTLALLDGKGNGFVITSLHARSGTRIFAKPVIEGKSGKYQFSKEEEEVVKKAMIS